MTCALVVVGFTLGAGLRAAEPTAYASSAECDDSHHARLVEVRRVAGTGAPQSQDVWRDRLLMQVTYLELSISDAEGSTEFRIEPEPAQ
jgi:hypothetical protein